jgi:3-oxoacyl-[acyl-carrier-protein] synthase-3
MDYEDRSVCILFGDGAGAVVLEGRDEPGGLLDVQLGSDGGNSDLITLPGGGSRRPASQAVLERREQFLRMNGNRVFKFAVQSMEQGARDTLGRVGWSMDDVTWLLAHQANRRILDAVAERLAFPPERMLINVEHTGNTSAASIPILLDESVRAGRIRSGDRLLLVAFGAGLTWGAAAIHWT